MLGVEILTFDNLDLFQLLMACFLLPSFSSSRVLADPSSIFLPSGIIFLLFMSQLPKLRLDLVHCLAFHE